MFPSGGSQLLGHVHTSVKPQLRLQQTPSHPLKLPGNVKKQELSTKRPQKDTWEQPRLPHFLAPRYLLLPMALKMRTRKSCTNLGDFFCALPASRDKCCFRRATEHLITGLEHVQAQKSPPPTSLHDAIAFQSHQGHHHSKG